LQTVTGATASEATPGAREAGAREVLAGALSSRWWVTDARPARRSSPVSRDRRARTATFRGGGDARSRGLLELRHRARAARPDLPLVPYATGWRWLLPLTRLSDNASFWDARYPSLMLTTRRSPKSALSRATDTGATLDYQFMAMVTEATRERSPLADAA